MRIRPDDMSFPTMPPAYGPGIHGDELSAAWHDIKDFLPPTIRSKFAAQYREDNLPPDERPASGSVRRRASGIAEAGSGAGDATMPTKDLYEIAMLTTGRWGILASPAKEGRGMFPSAAAFEPQKQKRVFEDTTYKPGQYMDFWTRMEELEKLLKSRGATALKRYESKGKSGGDWTDAIYEMIAAVSHVLSQRDLPAAERSIFKAIRGKTATKQSDVYLLPLGVQISVLSVYGNSKLPYIAYSELPMSTCPGAGACGVYKKDASSGAIVGWCYSFKAWRYPDAFKRQFLNTLANYADREFTILRNNGDDPTDGPDRYWPRIEAAMREREPRAWMQYVQALTMREAAKIVYDDVSSGMMPAVENGGRTVFFRLFVDGDIGQPDCIHSWMQVVRDMSRRDFIASAASVTGTKKVPMNPRWMNTVQTYGYSKCWGEFVALDRKFRGYDWPENYTLNMSSASTYESVPEISEAMRNLPISRGGFNAIDFRQHLQSLKKIKPEDIIMPENPPLPGVTEQQLRGIVAIEGIKYQRNEDGSLKLNAKGVPVTEDLMLAGAQLLDEYFGVRLLDENGRDITAKSLKADVTPKGEKDLPEYPSERKKYFDAFARESELAIRRRVLTVALENMLKDPKLSERVKREMARDQGFVNEAEFLADIESSYQKSLGRYAKDVERFEAKLAKGQAKQEQRPKQPERGALVTEKESQQEKKLVALLVHAIFIASRNSQSGSCPLICGNCADITVSDADEVYGSQQTFRDFAARTGAVHRCASRVPTEGYVPPEGKRLPKGVEIDRATGFTKPYERTRDGKVILVTGYYGAEIHIGLH